MPIRVVPYVLSELCASEKILHSVSRHDLKMNMSVLSMKHSSIWSSMHLVIGFMRCAPWPCFLYILMRSVDRTSHSAGAALFP